MGEVYERIQNLQGLRERGAHAAVQGQCAAVASTVSKAPLVAAAEAVAAVIPYSADTLKDGIPSRCRLSFRFAVMMAIMASVLVSCLGMFLPFQVVTSEIHSGILGTLNDSVDAQQQVIGELITANVTKSFEDVLAALEQMVQHCVKEPALNSAQDVWNSLRSWELFYAGWQGGRSEYDRTVLRHRSWVGFADTVNFTCRYGFDTPTRWDQRKIRGSYAAELLVGFSSGDYTSMELHFHEEQGLDMCMEDGAPVRPGGQTNVTQWKLDFRTGHTIEPPTGHHLMRLEEQPWYEVQHTLAQQARKNGSSLRLQPAWSKIYGSGRGDELGLAWTQPIAYCGDYSCFDGVVAFKVALAYLDAACEDLFQSMRKMLVKQYGYQIGRENSSVFIVNHKSRVRTQQGLLVGVSNEDIIGGRNASGLPHAEDSNQAIVQNVARALKDKFGSWDAPELQNHNQLFSFKWSHMKESGNLTVCADWASRALNKDCQQVATISVPLDSETSWLVVVTLPAGVFTLEMASIVDEVNRKVGDRTAEVKARIEEALLWAIVTFFLAAAVACVLGLILGWFVTRPLQRLAGLMRRLGDLDFAHNSYELQDLRSGTHSWVKEVGKLQKAFCRLSRGIELFSRFVPEAVVRNIVRGETWATRLHVTNRVVTIMFSDIRDFTSISEKLSQRDLLFVITRYLSVMTRIVELYDGVVSEVQGDGLLVLWNTPDDVEDHASRACAAALAQQQALALLNQDFARQGLPPLAVRIGLNTGEVMTGNLGSFTKMRFGCLGDPINLASRLEGLCKYYGVGIICSGATRDMLPENSFICRKLDLVQVKGRKEPTRVYEVVACQCWHPETPARDEASGDLEAGQSMPPLSSSLAVPLDVAKEVVTQEQRVSRDRIRWWRPWKHLGGFRRRSTSGRSIATMSDGERDLPADPIHPGCAPGDASPGLPVPEPEPGSSGSAGSGPNSDSSCGCNAGCLCLFPADCEQIRLYESALEAFQQARFLDAAGLLENFLRKSPDDLAALGLQTRLSGYLSADGKQVKGLPIEELSNWTGVLVMTDK